MNEKFFGKRLREVRGVTSEQAAAEQARREQQIRSDEQARTQRILDLQASPPEPSRTAQAPRPFAGMSWHG